MSRAKSVSPEPAIAPSARRRPSPRPARPMSPAAQERAILATMQAQSKPDRGAMFRSHRSDLRQRVENVAVLVSELQDVLAVAQEGDARSLGDRLRLVEVELEVAVRTAAEAAGLVEAPEPEVGPQVSIGGI